MAGKVYPTVMRQVMAQSCIWQSKLKVWTDFSEVKNLIQSLVALK